MPCKWTQCRYKIQEDTETATAIGCKSYNALTTELVTLEAQTVKALRGDTEEQLQILQAAVEGESMSGFTDDSFLNSVGTESSCDSTPDSKALGHILVKAL
uniref:Uncharacterized protein n=1 Tax=Noccaea caerulescens TaxID=107243 RepID=A0A1J3GLW3_NOCCA